MWIGVLALLLPDFLGKFLHLSKSQFSRRSTEDNIPQRAIVRIDLKTCQRTINRKCSIGSLRLLRILERQDWWNIPGHLVPLPAQDL